MRTVRFNYADVKNITLKNKRSIQDLLASIIESEGKELGHLNYVFCSDAFLLDINRRHLKHDYYTDIITFDLSASENILGEIYISIDRVTENAVLHNACFRDELLRVLIHGVLHLCGYNDKKKREITLMREKEEYYLQTFVESLK